MKTKLSSITLKKVRVVLDRLWYCQLGWHKVFNYSKKTNHNKTIEDTSGSLVL